LISNETVNILGPVIFCGFPILGSFLKDHKSSLHFCVGISCIEAERRAGYHSSGSKQG